MFGGRVDENDHFPGQWESLWLVSLRLESSYYSKILKKADQVARKCSVLTEEEEEANEDPLLASRCTKIYNQANC